MKQNRRKFVRTIAGSSFVASALGSKLFKTTSRTLLADTRKYGLDIDMRVGAIGMGIMGFNNVQL